jgi:hypothetical protein
MQGNSSAGFSPFLHALDCQLLILAVGPPVDVIVLEKSEVRPLFAVVFFFAP